MGLAQKQKPMIFVSSMARCGSTWVYNITRELCRSAGVTPWPETIPPLDDELMAAAMSGDPGEGRVWCIKTHRSIRSPESRIRIICPYRDVRDSLVSYMRFRAVSFDQALESVQEMMEVTDWYLKDKPDNVHALRYDTIIHNPVKAATDIAGFIGLAVPPEVLVKITGQFSRDRVARYIQDFEGNTSDSAGRPGQPRVSMRNIDGDAIAYDPATGFQSGHVGSLPDGSWRSELDQHQQDRLHELAGDWLQRYDFETP